MWLMTDNSDAHLTNFLEELIHAYVKQPVKRSRCGYACSDHASWYHEGYAASIPFESHMDTFNPDIHSPRDTMDKLSLDHMTNFAKLSVAFAVELAEPRQA
jgi:leucyl aminopeptidase